MTDTGTAIDARRLGEAIRQACVAAALAGCEHASSSGLCQEGAWEAAVSAIRSVDLGGLVGGPAESEASAEDTAESGGL